MALALAFAALSSGSAILSDPAPVAVSSFDAEAVVLEVLRYEALRSRHGSMCLRRKSSGIPFHWPAGNNSRWSQAVVPPPGFAQTRRLFEQDEEELGLAAARAIATQPSAGAYIVIASSRVPERLRSEDPSCAELFFTIPAIAGDMAFVETTYSCGSLCAEGWRYALKRREGRWSLFAVSFLWIS